MINGIPNSSDLFFIYQAQLESLNSLHEFIVSNKIDDKYYRTIKKNIKHSSKLVKYLVDHLLDISNATMGLKANPKMFDTLKTAVDAYINIVTNLQNLKLSSILMSKLSIKLLSFSMEGMLDFIEVTGRTNPLRIKMAQINLALLEQAMMYVDTVIQPIKGISLKDVITSTFNIWKIKRLFKKLKKLIRYIGLANPLFITVAAKNLEMIEAGVGNIYGVVSYLGNNISYKTVRMARRNIRRLNKIIKMLVSDRKGLFGRRRASMFTMLGNMDIKELTKSLIISTLIVKSLDNIYDAISVLDDYGSRIRYKQVRKGINDTYSLMFGDDGRIFGWGFVYGIIPIVEDVKDSITIREAAKAAAIVLSLRLFFKNVNIILGMIDNITLIEKIKLSIRLKRLRKLLLGTYKNQDDSIIGIMLGVAKYSFFITQGAISLVAISVGMGTIVVILSAMKFLLPFSIVAKWAMKNLIKFFTFYVDAMKIITEEKNKKSIEDGTKVLDIISGSLQKIVTIFTNIPKPTDVLKAMLSILLIQVFIFEYIGLLMFTQWVIIKLMKKRLLFARGEKNPSPIDQIIKSMSDTMSKVADVIVKANSISTDIIGAIKAIGLITTVLVLMIGVFIVVDKLGTSVRDASKNLAKLSLGLTALIGIIGAMIIAGIIIVLGMVFIGVTVLFIGVMVGLFWLIGKAGKELLYGAAGLALVSVSLLFFVFTMLTIARMIDTYGGMTVFGAFVGTAGLAAIITIIANRIKSIGKPKSFKEAILGSMGLILIGIAANTFAASIMIIAEAAQKLGGEVKGGLLVGGLMFVFCIMIEMLVDTVTLMGSPIISEAAMTGAGIMILIGAAVAIFAGSVWVIADAIEKVSKIKLEKDDDRLARVVNLIANGVKAVWENFLWLNPVTMGVAMMRVGSMSVMATCLGNMAQTLHDIATMQIPYDFDEKGNPTKWRRMNTTDFIKASVTAGWILAFFTRLFAWQDYQGKPLPGKNPLDVIEKIRGKHKRRMRKLADIVASVGDMAEILQKLASMSYPTKFDPETGAGLEWKQMDRTAFSDASANVATIITNLVTIFENKTVQDALKAAKNKRTKRTQAVLEAISPITNIIEAVTQLATGSCPTEFDPETGEGKKYISFKEYLTQQNKDKAANNIKTLLLVAIDGLNQVPWDNLKKAKARVDKFGDVFESIGNLVSKLSGSVEGGNEAVADKIKANLEETRQLLVQINNTDVTKLKYAFSLMHSISTLSTSIRGNFEGLSKTISEDLINALKELKDVLEQINGGVQVQASGTDLQQTSQVQKNGQPTNDLANSQKEGNKVKGKETKEDPNLARIKALLESVIQSGAVNVNQNSLLSYNS